MKRWLVVAIACVLSAEVAAPAAEKPAAPAATAPAAPPAPLYVGLRRSSYGGGKKNNDDAWWADRAKAYAAHFPGATPVIVEILSVYQNNGGTQMEFVKPAEFKGPTHGMTFAQESIDHERALKTYDQKGVKALLQFESGSADGVACLEAAWQRFQGHPCIAGFGFDAEWYFAKGSPKEEGLPIPDADARRFMEKVLTFNPNFVLFLKHWDASHMPQTYRHPNLWFVSDSQEFKSRAEWLKDLGGWAGAFKGSVSGFQFGYPKDKPWWGKEPSPPAALGEALRRSLPRCGCLLWVDFTASQVEFTKPAA